MDAVQKIIDLMQQKGITAKRLTSEAGLSSSAITEWKKGKSKPSAKSLQKIADYFHVSTDYLLSGEEPKKISPPADNAEEDDIDINNLNFALSGEVHDLSEDEIQEIVNFARFMRQQRKLRDQKKKQTDGDKKDG